MLTRRVEQRQPGLLKKPQSRNQTWPTPEILIHQLLALWGFRITEGLLLMSPDAQGLENIHAERQRCPQINIRCTSGVPPLKNSTFTQEPPPLHTGSFSGPPGLYPEQPWLLHGGCAGPVKPPAAPCPPKGLCLGLCLHGGSTVRPQSHQTAQEAHGAVPGFRPQYTSREQTTVQLF